MNGRSFATRMLLILSLAMSSLTLGRTATAGWPDGSATPSRLTVTGNSRNTVPTLRRKLSRQEVAERLMDSTCHIAFVRDNKNVHFGTGWVLDVDRRLVITNHHVIDSKGPPSELRVYFPVKKDGEWVVEDTHYFQKVRPSIGRIVFSTRQHDLALLQLDRLPANVTALPLAQRSAPRGSQLHSVGGKPLGSDSMWPYTNGVVRQVGKARNALGYASRMIQAQMQTNKGNSGGPIVNDYAEIVGVCEGHWDSIRGHRVRGVSLYVDLKPLREFVEKTRPLVQPSTAAAYFTRGQGHLATRRIDAALQDLSAAIRLDRKHAPAYLTRARVFQKKGDHRTAIADCDKAIKLNGGTAEAHHTRGDSNRLLKKYDDAIRDYTNAISNNPNGAIHYHRRALTQFFAGKTKDSFPDFVRATQLDPKNDFYWGERGYIRAAAQQRVGFSQELHESRSIQRGESLSP